MNIETQFEVGDVVWYVDKNTLTATSSSVLEIQIIVRDVTYIFYKVNEGDNRLENQIFASQTDLATSFEPL